MLSRIKLPLIKPILLAVAVIGATMSGAASAEVAFTITKDAVRDPGLAIVPFAGSPQTSQIISQDLSLTGRFNMARSIPQQVASSTQMSLPLWQAQQIPYAAVGRVSGNQITYELVEIGTGRLLLSETLSVPTGRMSAAAHLIADKIAVALTGTKTDFSGQLLFVTKTGPVTKPVFSLQVGSTDGSGNQIILESTQPIRSPVWSPNGRQIAYVSYETGRPFIYLQDVINGQRSPLVQLSGTNGAPSFSPDGRNLLFSSSATGNFEIYQMNLGSRQINQITRSRGVDTEPSYAPDGRSFVFTSDRSGSPQIYSYNLQNGQVSRLSLTGSYNARASYNKDGTKIALISNYRAAIMDVASGAIQILGNSPYDESPSFSPSGDVLVYATKSGNKDIISMVSANGKTRLNLPGGSTSVRDPAWTP